MKYQCPDERCPRVFFYDCKICHDILMSDLKDDNDESKHEIGASDVKIIKCSFCETV